MAPKILLIGLPWNHPMVAAQIDPTIIRDGLEKVKTTLIDSGYDYSTFFLAPEDDVQPFVDVLKDNAFDGVVIGFGVRGSTNPTLTALLETIVNTIKDESPRSKILFNTSPQSSLDAAKRWFPIS